MLACISGKGTTFLHTTVTIIAADMYVCMYVLSHVKELIREALRMHLTCWNRLLEESNMPWFIYILNYVLCWLKYIALPNYVGEFAFGWRMLIKRKQWMCVFSYTLLVHLHIKYILLFKRTHNYLYGHHHCLHSLFRHTVFIECCQGREMGWQTGKKYRS